jgi:hypothetical protein
MTPHIIDGNSLDTGDERDFVHKPTKDREPYPKFTAGTDFDKKVPEPDQVMKPYVEYSNIWKEPEAETNIKE